MSAVATYASGAAALIRRDVTVYFSYRLRFAGQVATALFTLTLFYYISRLVTVESFASPDTYFAFVVVGLAILGALVSTLVSGPTAIRQELVAGTFERLATSPLGAVASVISLMVFPLLLAVLTGAATLLCAALVFDLSLSSSAPLALPVVLLGGLAFAPFGVFLAAAVMVTKQAAAAGRVLIALLTIVAGFYFPVSLLPDWVEWTSHVQPFTPSVELLRHLLVGAPLESPAWLLLAKLAGFAAVLMPVSVWTLHRAVELSRRRGTIIEY
jgi:ABC-2 type transport system permease protein